MALSRADRAKRMISGRDATLWQSPKARRIGRGNIYHKKIRVGRKAAREHCVICRGVLRIFVFAKVYAHEPCRLNTILQTRDNSWEIIVVESHAIDDGAISAQPKYAWLRVAQLRPRGYTANLDKTKTYLQRPR